VSNCSTTLTQAITRDSEPWSDCTWYADGQLKCALEVYREEAGARLKCANTTDTRLSGGLYEKDRQVIGGILRCCYINHP
jgi:hypothetical protein